MKLSQIQEDYRICTVHNPKQFYPNSFQVAKEGGRVILIGRVKRHIRKSFRIVAILKPR